VYGLLRGRGVEVELTADHVVTKSFYVLDPDGNRLEFYAQLVPAAEAKRYLHDLHVAADVLRPLDLEALVG
jgi:catechol-2,3-dioxygenase